MEISVQAHLDEYLKANGEDAWKQEVRRLATAGAKTSPKHEAFWRDLTKDYAWLDWNDLKNDATGTPQDPERMLSDLIRRQMPGIKSQAQYNAVVNSMDVLREVINAILSGDKTKEVESQKALAMALQVLTSATGLTEKLEEVPEAATSKAAEECKAPPAQFGEADVLKELMGNLVSLESVPDLNAWYAATKQQRDRIVTQSLRNELLDAIRNKKNQLS